MPTYQLASTATASVHWNGHVWNPGDTLTVDEFVPIAYLSPDLAKTSDDPEPHNQTIYGATVTGGSGTDVDWAPATWTGLDFFSQRVTISISAATDATVTFKGTTGASAIPIGTGEAVTFTRWYKDIGSVLTITGTVDLLVEIA
jgi:hypothetical protein